MGAVSAVSAYRLIVLQHDRGSIFQERWFDSFPAARAQIRSAFARAGAGEVAIQIGRHARESTCDRAAAAVHSDHSGRRMTWTTLGVWSESASLPAAPAAPAAAERLAGRAEHPTWRADHSVAVSHRSQRAVMIAGLAASVAIWAALLVFQTDGLAAETGTQTVRSMGPLTVIPLSGADDARRDEGSAPPTPLTRSIELAIGVDRTDARELGSQAGEPATAGPR